MSGATADDEPDSPLPIYMQKHHHLLFFPFQVAANAVGAAAAEEAALAGVDAAGQEAAAKMAQAAVLAAAAVAGESDSKDMSLCHILGLK